MSEELKALLEAAETALGEMCRTAAPRSSFTDAVEALDAAIRASRSAQEAQSLPEPAWVSVDERLPAIGDEVLIVFRGCSLPATGQYTNSPRDHGGWCYPGENRWTVEDEEWPAVTHWMPLPPPPADEETGK